MPRDGDIHFKQKRWWRFREDGWEPIVDDGSLQIPTRYNLLADIPDGEIQEEPPEHAGG